MKTRAIVNLALAIALVILAGLGWHWYRNRLALVQSDRWENHTYTVIQQFEELLSALKDVETGQRGFLLTGMPDYLEPYNAALAQLDQKLASLQSLTKDNPRQQQRLTALEPLIRAKLAELKETIALRNGPNGITGTEAAREIVLTGRGKALMDQIRNQVAEAKAEEERLLNERTLAKEDSSRHSFFTVAVGGLFSCGLLLTAFFLLKRELHTRQRAEQELRKHRDHLEELVGERTRELAEQNEELQRQGEELNQQAEELEQQNEELQQQGEELQQQSEELQAQAGELAAANQELNAREAMLQAILDSLRDTSNEQQVLTRVCEALLQLVGQPAVTAAVVEKFGEQLLVRAHAGTEKPEEWSFANSFAALVMAEGRTAFVPDLAQRPDLSVPNARERSFRSLLATPLRVNGQVIGAVKVYCPEPRQWTKPEFRMVEWAAAQCSLALETMRLQQELRQSEEQFRALADSIPNLAWWANADGYITWYNHRWYEYTGTTPQQMEGWGWQSVHDPEILPRVLERWKASIASGQPFAMEFPLRGADGQFRWFLTRVMPLRDATGRVARWFGTNTDVSESREAREALARHKADLERLVSERTAKLQELVSELEHFSYTITHDMRAPLRAMKGYAEMVNELCASCPQEEQKSLLRRIMTSADRMDALIRDALNYSRAVRQELPLEPVDIPSLLRGMLESYPEWQRLDSAIAIDGELPVVVGNKAGLTQCFSNLLGNAIKFVRPGQPPDIRIWAERSDGQARIWVEDRGIGIPKSMLPRVFDMFSRGHKTYEGTGIGLALVRKVMDRMGGRVGVESQEGQGSRFWLELPVAPADSAAAHKPQH